MALAVGSLFVCPLAEEHRLSDGSDTEGLLLDVKEVEESLSADGVLFALEFV